MRSGWIIFPFVAGQISHLAHTLGRQYHLVDWNVCLFYACTHASNTYLMLLDDTLLVGFKVQTFIPSAL